MMKKEMLRSFHVDCSSFLHAIKIVPGSNTYPPKKKKVKSAHKNKTY